MDDWEYPNNIETELYSLEDIQTIPVSLIIGKTDSVCAAERAYELADRLSTVQNIVTIKNTGHDMTLSGPTFLNLLADELVEGSGDTKKWSVTLNDKHPDNDTAIFDDIEVIEPSNSLEDCEEGCFECYNAYMLYSPADVYQVCKETRAIKFGNKCPNNKKYNDERCNAEGQCLKSYPYEDPKKWRSRDTACRTVPEAYLNPDLVKYAKKTCRKSKQGMCSTCSDDEKCSWSYLIEDPD